MDPTGGRDTRYNLQYMMPETPEIYGNPNNGGSLARPPSSGGLVGQVSMSRGGSGGGTGMMNGPQCGSGGGGGGGGAGGGGGGGGGGLSRGIKRTNSDCYDDRQLVVGSGQTLTGLDGCTVGSEVVDESYTSLQPKKSPPSNGKKTKGRVKIKMEYIDNKLRRYTTFSKRKTGIMKKAYELSTLTGTQVMLLVASETGHVYTFATRKLQPMITSEAGKALIQTCLNSPDPPTGSSGDQRMSATGFEETELSYNIGDEDSKDDRSPMSSGSESDDCSGPESPPPPGPSSSTMIISNQHQQQHHSGPSEKPSIRHHHQPDEPEALRASSVSSSSSPSVLTASTAAATISTIQQQIQQQQQALQQQIQHLQQQQQQQQQIQQHKQSATPKQPTAGRATGKASPKVKVEPLAPAASTASPSVPTTTTTSVATLAAAPQITSSIIYPAAALSTLPQDVLVNLLQSGQIQLHSEENGSQQYVTIPLPLISTKANPRPSSNGQHKMSGAANPVSSGPPASSSSTSTTRRGSSASSSSSRRNASSASSTIKTEPLE